LVSLSRHIIERVNGEAVSVTHQVEVDGEVIHKHQRYNGKYGTERYFPPEWTRYPYIGWP
jgi:nitrous oxide reductase